MQVSLFGSRKPDTGDSMILHAIVAVACRFSTDPRLDREAQAEHRACAKRNVLLYAIDNSSVKALQALAILALDVVGDLNGPPGWNTLALLTRGVMHLGLGVEPTSTTKLPASIHTLGAVVLPISSSPIEEEQRRRLFWGVWVLDRYATVATSFDFALNDDEVDRVLPCRDDLLASDQVVKTPRLRSTGGLRHGISDANVLENIGPFAYYIDILGILSQIHRFLRKPVDIRLAADVDKWQNRYRVLDSRLHAWKYGLPNKYGNITQFFHLTRVSEPIDSMWVMLHITYHT